MYKGFSASSTYKFAALISLLILWRPALSQTAHAAGEEPSVSVDIEFNSAELSFGSLEGYDLIQLEDASYGELPGQPMLPSRLVKIALPDGMIAQSARADNITDSVLEGEFFVYPAQPPRRISATNDETGFVPPSADIYASNKAFPGEIVDLIRQSDLAGQSYAVVRVNPLIYTPGQKKLRFIDHLSIVLEGKYGYECGDYLPPGSSTKTRDSYAGMLREMVINPGAVQLAEGLPQDLQAGVAPGNYDYVIITASSYSGYFQPLADWKTRKGVPATIVTTSWIYGEYSGSTNEQKIRAFVIDAHSTWGTIYFLLGGDTNIIPYYTRNVDGDDIPNDTYYADYDNDWTCEVHVGRASVRSTAAINTFINKIMTYEQDPPVDYATKAALFGFDLDWLTQSEECKMDIDDSYIPSGWTMSNVYDSDGGNHKTNVISAINSGQNLINHSDHSSEYSMGTGYENHNLTLDTGDMDALNNGDRQSILYSLGCWANAYDYQTCIAEHFVQDSNGGGVAFVGNSRYGWYNPGNYNSLSMTYDRYFFRSLLSQSHFHLGECFSDHKNDGPTGSVTEQYIYTELTLLGDPELLIWTDDPIEMTVNHPDQLPSGLQTAFTVHVEEVGGGNLLAALVCLWKDGEVYLTGLTNIAGNVTLYPEPSSTGTMYVTVSKHNYLPYLSEAEVQEHLGTIAGVITDQADQTVIGVRAYCTSPAIEDYSDASGGYSLYGFEPGVYSVSYSHPDYLDTTITGITVLEGSTTIQNVVLRPPPDDVGMVEILNPPAWTMTGTPCAIECIVKNFGSNAHAFTVTFEARLQGSSGIAFSANQAVPVMQGITVDTVTFSSQFTPLFDTLYELTAYTVLTGDMNPGNDEATADCQSTPGVGVWYGNTSDTPITAFVGAQANIDVYVLTSPDVYCGDLHLCLGADDQYIEELTSHLSGQVYYPLTEWALATFLAPQGSPPNPGGWSSQSFTGYAKLDPYEDNPWLHTDVPTRVMTFTADIIDDDELIGQIIDAIGPGVNAQQGPSNASDTLGQYFYIVHESHCPVYFRDPFATCDFLPGDVNGDGQVLGGDVSRAVAYFGGEASPPPDSCFNDSTGDWHYAAADANGDCLFVGGDVTFLVNYFGGTGEAPRWCPQTPPLEPPTISMGKKPELPK